MASEPPLILAFDTSAAHCAAALVSGRRGARRPRRGDGPRPGRAAAADARGAAGRGRRRLGRPRRRSRSAPGPATSPACASPSPRRAGSRWRSACRRSGSAASRRWPAPAGPVRCADRRPQRGTVFVQAFRDGARRSAEPARPAARSAAGRRRAAASTAPDLPRRPRRARGSRRGRLGRAPPPAPLYLRPADAMPPAEPPPRILDDA